MKALFFQGATLRLDTWDGWAEFLRGCLTGHKTTVQRHLSKERPVMRSECVPTTVHVDHNHSHILSCLQVSYRLRPLLQTVTLPAS